MEPKTTAFWETVPNEGPLLHIVHVHRDGSNQELVVGEVEAAAIAKVIAAKPTS